MPHLLICAGNRSSAPGREQAEKQWALDAYILIPQSWILPDELFHQADAFVVLHNFNRDAARAEKLFFANKRPVLADDDAGDSVEQNRAGAHGAGRERGIEDAFAVDGGGLAAGIFQRVHFAVQNRAAFLYPPVMAASNDLPLMHNYRADRNAAFRQSLAGFFNCGLK